MSTGKADNQAEVPTGPAPVTGAGPAKEREPDAVYQNGELVARVTNPQVDLEAKEIRFTELYNSDELLLPDECEFQKYIIIVQRIGFASKVEKTALHKGRVLRDVVAEILGYREQ
jgi:hypothetical protein